MAVPEISVPDKGDACDPLAGLLRRVANQDRQAFRELYLFASPRLYAIALALAHDSQIAAEALQVAMVQIWQKSYLFNATRGTAEAWVTGIVRFRTLDILASAKRCPLDSDADLAELIDEAAFERLERTAVGSRLRHCLSQLDIKNRDGIILAYVYGYSHSQIAAKLQIPVGSAKSWIRRGLVTLKSCVGG